MKKIFTFLFFVAVSISTIQAQITSAASGDWSATATWVGGVVPSTTSNVVIASGHTVTIGTAAAAAVPTVVCANLTVDAGGILTINTPSGSATTYNTINPRGTLTVNGTINCGITTVTGPPAYTLGGRIESNGTAMTLTGTGTINNPQFQFTLDATIPSGADLTFGLATGTSNLNGVSGKSLNLAGSIKVTNAGTFFINNAVAIAGGTSGTINVIPSTGNISLSHSGALTVKTVNIVTSGTRTIAINGAGTHTFTDVVISGAGTGAVTLGTTAGTTNLNCTKLSLGTVPARVVTLNSTSGTGNITGTLSGEAIITRRIAGLGAALTSPSGATIAPGNSPGKTAIAGDFTNQGTLNMELGGATAGTGHDQITATGVATLGGTLNVTLINSYDPPLNQAFTLIDAGTSTGIIPSVSLPTLTGGKYWLPTAYNDAAGTVIIQVAPTVLPIELSSFTATKNNNTTAIVWATETESNNAYFNIERSTNGTDFRSIGKKEGAGNSASRINYSFTDENPTKGINYYRLKQTDFDGRFTYSKVQSVNHNAKNQVAVSPKATQGNLNINTDLQEYNVVVYNVAGQVVKTIANLSFEQNIDINELNEGIYFLKISSENTFVETIKVTKF